MSRFIKKNIPNRMWRYLLKESLELTNHPRAGSLHKILQWATTSHFEQSFPMVTLKVRSHPSWVSILFKFNSNNADQGNLQIVDCIITSNILLLRTNVDMHSTNEYTQCQPSSVQQHVHWLNKRVNPFTSIQPRWPLQCGDYWKYISVHPIAFAVGRN